MDPLLELPATKAPQLDIGLIYLMPASGSLDQPWRESLRKLEKARDRRSTAACRYRKPDPR
jgi:hypothetical protein